MFWKKKKPEIKVLTVKPEDTKKILYLMDKFGELPVKQARVAKYELWQEIKNLFPEIPDDGCTISNPNSTTVKIEYEISKEGAN